MRHPLIRLPWASPWRRASLLRRRPPKPSPTPPPRRRPPPPRRRPPSLQRGDHGCRSIPSTSRPWPPMSSTVAARAASAREKTVEYLEEQFKQLGLQARQRRQLVPDRADGRDPRRSQDHARADREGPAADPGLRRPDGDRHAHRPARGQARGTRRWCSSGYGVNAPEAGLERLRRPRRQGQDRGDADQRPGLPSARTRSCSRAGRMTYYGRWTYKFEEAARQGAAGVLIVHETEAAALRLGRGAQRLDRPAVRPAAGGRRRAAPADAGLDHQRSRDASCSPTPASTSRRSARPPTSAASSRCRWMRR